MRRPRRRARSNRGVRGSGTPCRDRYARTDSGARGRARRGGRGPPRTDGSGGLVLSVQAERDDGCDAKGVLRVAGATGAIDELADRGATSGASDVERVRQLVHRGTTGADAIFLRGRERRAHIHLRLMELDAHDRREPRQLCEQSEADGGDEVVERRWRRTSTRGRMFLALEREASDASFFELIADDAH